MTGHFPYWSKSLLQCCSCSLDEQSEALQSNMHYVLSHLQILSMDIWKLHKDKVFQFLNNAENSSFFSWWHCDEFWSFYVLGNCRNSDHFNAFIYLTHNFPLPPHHHPPPPPHLSLSFPGVISFPKYLIYLILKGSMVDYLIYHTYSTIQSQFTRTICNIVILTIWNHVGFSSSSWGEQLWTKAARKDIWIPERPGSPLMLSPGMTLYLFIKATIFCKHISLAPLLSLLPKSTWLMLYVYHIYHSMYQILYLLQSRISIVLCYQKRI